MSTVPVITPVTTTGSTTVTINSTEAEINAALAAERTAATVEPTTPPAEAAPTTPDPAAPVAPFTWTDKGGGLAELKLSTGEVFVGTAQEVAQKVASSKVDTTNYAKELKTKLDAVPAASSQVAPAAQNPNVNIVTPDSRAAEQAALQNRYFESIQQGKLGDATSIGLEQFLGTPADEIRGTLTELTEMLGEYKLNRAVGAFKRECPDFPDDTPSITALTTILGNAPVTVDNLKKAHSLAIYEKKYTPLTQDQIAARWSTAAPAAVAGRVPTPIIPNAAPVGNIKAIDINSTQAEIDTAIAAEKARLGIR